MPLKDPDPLRALGAFLTGSEADGVAARLAAGVMMSPGRMLRSMLPTG